jgi:NAD(P)-dependent dehydrogenase (short-subunit alcohol dehydrogenase family)
MRTGHVVAVTGAAKGIGRYAAQTLAREGARLAVSDIEPLDKVSAELQGLGADVLAVKADVRDENQVKRAVAQIIERFGRIDGLINNAGIVTHFSWAPRWPRIRDMDKAFWDRVIETNLGGTVLWTKHVLPHMEARRAGHIVNLYGGTDPKQMGIGGCAYAVSKEAIRMFTRFVAEEEREQNICVVVVAPGAAIATEDAPEEVRRRLPGPDYLENLFVLALQAGMELSGQLLLLKEGRLTVVP